MRRREAVSMTIPIVYCVTSIAGDEVFWDEDGLDVVERMTPRVTKSTDAYAIGQYLGPRENNCRIHTT